MFIIMETVILFIAIIGIALFILLFIILTFIALFIAFHITTIGTMVLGMAADIILIIIDLIDIMEIVRMRTIDVMQEIVAY